jgi:hypothetical protein
MNFSQICLFEFIRVEAGVKSMKHFKGCARYESLGASYLVSYIGRAVIQA